MKILILEDEQRNAMRLIRLLNDIDTTFITSNPQLSSSASFLRLNVLSSLN